MKSLYWSTLPPIVAGAAVVGRWLMQSTGNLYTDFGKDLYLPDPDLGWRLTHTSITWLGLDAVLATGAFAMGIALACWLLLRVENKRGARQPRLRLALRTLAPASLIVPMWAFASGSAPEGARDQLPTQSFVHVAKGGNDGRLPALAAGRYEVQEHQGTQITASVEAGGEDFESRFAGAPQGFLRFDPGNLAQPIVAEVSVASASVDTGIELRSKHAREKLEVQSYPRIVFTLDGLLASAQQAANTLSFSAQGSVTLMGTTQDTQVSGSLSAPDAAARSRLGFPDAEVLLVKASFSISLEKAAIKNEGSFDEDIIPIQVSLILVRAKNK